MPLWEMEATAAIQAKGKLLFSDKIVLFRVICN
jgi:hypothetical protein